MNISTMIADAAIQYPESKNGPFAGAPIGQVIKEEIPEALRNKLSLTDYVIKGSIGNGNFASIPWIAIMDKEITTSTIKYLNNLIEQDHRPVKRRNKFYRSLRTASPTIKGMEAIRGLYKKTRKEGTLFGFSVCTEIKVLLGIPA